MTSITTTTKKGLSRSTARSAFCLTVMLCGRAVNAQLMGCDSVHCPPDISTGHGSSNCTLDGVVGTAIGIANFTTAISPEPLTWTLAISNNDKQTFFGRDFYLGTPPALNMTDITATTGCALFFEDVTSSLHFPGSSLNSSVGTCSDAMGPACVTDLISQSKAELDIILQVVRPGANVCAMLAAVLSNSAPNTCNATQSGSWGNVTTKAITGPSAPHPIQLGDCHPTTGAHYSLSHIENDNLTTVATATNVSEPFLEGITPIMTLFFPTIASTTEKTVATTNSRDSLKGPELHLSCMKAVQLKQQPPVRLGASSSIPRPFIGAGILVAMVAGIFITYL